MPHPYNMYNCTSMKIYLEAGSEDLVVEKPLVGAVPHGAHTGHPQGHVQQLGWNSLKDMEDTGTPCLRSS